MDPGTLADAFEQRGPWTTQFLVGDKFYGGNYDPLPNCRVDYLFQYFPAVETILELGSFEGGHSFLLAKHGAVKRVLGIEARQSHIDRARFVQGVLGIDNVEFVRANLEELDISDLGRFDLVVCIGVLYHLSKPWQLVEQMARTARHAYICTQYLSLEDSGTVVHGCRGAYRDKLGWDELVSGLSPRSYWLALDSLIDLLRNSCYKQLHMHLNLEAKNLAHIFCTQDP